VRAALDRDSDVAGVLITSPTPYGTCADITAIADLCHERGLPLLVDEAWGAHLPFHERLPTWAMDAGADLCVVSIHKMGAGLEQGSVFHLQGDRVDPTFLAACADMLSTTSPNTLIYAAMDGWRRQMVQHGHDLLTGALDLAADVREHIAKIPGLDPLHDALVGAEASHELDELKILVDVSALGISGYQAADWLREHRAVDVGLSDHRRIEAQLTFADDAGTANLLLDALGAMAEAAAGLPDPPRVNLPSPRALELDVAMPPRDAFFARTEDVPVDRAVGRVCAEQVTPYPPGIPVLLPGERVSEEIADYLTSGVRAGMVLPDPADPGLGTLRVVA
jgi:arginine decarboxylase